MNSFQLRQRAMRFPVLVAVLALSSVAWAQTEDLTAPPMVPADQPVAPPYPTSPQQPAQPQYPNQQYPNQQYPNQQYPNQQYPNQQYPNQQYPNQQQQRPQQPRQVQPENELSTGPMISSRTKHFVGLLSGSLGVGDTGAGVVGNARAEIDIAKIGLLFSYSNFVSTVNAFSNTIQVHQFNVMAGYSFFSTDLLTLRALGGLDIMTRDGVTGVGPVLGSTLRSMWGSIGVDAAFMMTLFPFRQFELRAAFVIAWSIFEAHLGWRVQVIDATQSGTLATLLSTSPGINGPVIGIGLTF